LRLSSKLPFFNRLRIVPCCKLNHFVFSVEINNYNSQVCIDTFMNSLSILHILFLAPDLVLSPCRVEGF